jgi:hypothetical protein
MPEISRFFGIIIKMFWEDHQPPHFHAFYAGQQAIIEIYTLSVFAGGLSPRALGLVIEWANCHQQALLENWRRAQAQQPLQKIAPLQ